MDLEEFVKGSYQDVRDRMAGMVEPYTQIMRIVMVKDHLRPELWSIFIYPVVDAGDQIDPVTLKRIK